MTLVAGKALGPDMLLEDVVDEVAGRIWTERAGSVLAIWADGRMTVEGLGFYGHRRADGTWSVPLASFPALRPVTHEQIETRLMRQLRRHGLMP